MKIKTSQYLADIAAAEQRGYLKGREELRKEEGDYHRYDEVCRALGDVQKEIQAIKGQMGRTLNKRVNHPCTNAPISTDIGEEIAEKITEKFL